MQRQSLVPTLRATLFKCNASPLCRLCPPCSNATPVPCADSAHLVQMQRQSLVPTLPPCSNATPVPCADSAHLVQMQRQSLVPTLPTLFRCNAQSLVPTLPTLFRCNARPISPAHLVQMQRSPYIACAIPCSNATPVPCADPTHLDQIQRSPLYLHTYTLVKCNANHAQMQRTHWPNATLSLAKCNGDLGQMQRETSSPNLIRTATTTTLLYPIPITIMLGMGG